MEPQAGLGLLFRCRYSFAWSPWAVLVAEPLHGLTFALIWSGLATLGAEAAPHSLEA